MSDSKEPENTEGPVDVTPDVPTPKDAQPEPVEKTDVKDNAQEHGTDWKSEARKWESRAKKNHAELSEKDKQIEELQQRVDGFESQEQKTQSRIEVADDLGIPVSALKGISGETPEEIKTNAEALLSLGKRSPHIPNIGDAPKAKRTTAEIFADHIRSQI